MTQDYCISARCRYSGFTEDITGPMRKENADLFQPSPFQKKTHKYFRVSKHPFKRHKKYRSPLRVYRYEEMGNKM